MTTGVAQILLGLFALAGVAGIAFAQKERRHRTGASRAPRSEENWASATFTRQSRLTNLSLVLASLALLASAVLVGLRAVEGHDASDPGSAESASGPTLVVNGRGTAPLVPDTAAVVIGLEGTWSSLEQATQQIDAAIQAAASVGVDPSDVQTITYHVTPAQITNSDGSPAAIQSIQINRRVALMVRDLDRLDAVLAAVADAGVRIFAVGIGVENPGPAQAAARAAALADARSKADEMAAAQGMTVLHAEETIEFESGTVPPTPLRAAGIDPAAGPPSETGQVEAWVQVTYAVE
jgi:uncharacterized protein YggE